jgi:hypothetical protein
MAKRVIKKKTSSKQTAAARRTKKTATKVKKTPTKKKTAKTATKTAVKKKRTVVKGKNPTKVTTMAQAASKPKTKRQKKEEDKYIRVSENANIKRFAEMGERVQRGEVKWSHYAIDGNVGYHHYRVLKK